MYVTYSPEPSPYHKAPWMYEVIGWDLAARKPAFQPLEVTRLEGAVSCDVPPGTILAWGRLDVRKSKSQFHYGIVITGSDDRCLVSDLFRVTPEQIRAHCHGL